MVGRNTEYKIKKTTTEIRYVCILCFVFCSTTGNDLTGPAPIARLSPRGLGLKMKVEELSVVSLGCATRAKKAKLDTKVGRLLLKRNLNV